MRAFLQACPCLGSRRVPAGVCVVLLVVIGLSGGCLNNRAPGAAAAQEPSRRNWWNYYERALDRIAHDDFLGGSEDLERVLGQRTGARPGLIPSDMWRARTYGLHFVEGFFPRRELGICYYRLGRLAEAAAQLERSLQQQSTGRARHYLNLTRAALIRGAHVSAPIIRIDTPGDSLCVTDRMARLEGQVEAAGYVRKVWINEQPEFVELAEAARPFVRRLALSEGSNVVVVAAEDLLGQKARREFHVTADWRPPSLVVRGSSRQGASWRFDVLCLDDQGLASVIVNGVERFRRPADGAAPVEWAVPVEVTETSPAIVELRDVAGNPFRSVLTPPRVAIAAGPPAALLYASAAAEGVPDGLVAPSPAAALTAADTLPPILEVKGQAQTLATCRDQYYLEGTASDWRGRGLEAITVNGTSVLRGKERGASEARFGLRLALTPGTNLFLVIAIDGAGNRTEQRVQVVRRTPQYLDDELRLRVAVVPPVVAEDEALRQRVLGHITARMTPSGGAMPARFHLVERDGPAWDAILREYELSRPDVADARAALQCGRLLPAEMLLITSVLKDARGLTLRGRMLETETGKAVWADDVYSESVEEFCGDQIPGFILKLEQAFPLVGARIAGVKGSAVSIDAGTEDGVRSGTRFLVVSQAPAPGGELSGDVLDGVQLRLERVAARRGVGVILPAGSTSRVKPGDSVYAR